MSKGLEWRTIKDFSGYSVSNYGDIKNNNTNKILKTYMTKRKYVYANIKSDSGKYFNCQVHRLVALAFIPNPLNKPCVNHIDYNPSNNYVENLEWVNHSENALHSKEHIGNAHRGKTRTQQQKFNISRNTCSKDRELGHHIYRNRNHFMFVITISGKRHSKTFKTLEETVAYRNKYLEERCYEI